MTPRSAQTREKLITAGRRRFAAEGWTTARIRDIVADAEQSNDSAINYHFGSRAGLLDEILRIGIAAMEEQRHHAWEELASRGEDLADPLPITTVVDMVIRPLAEHLQTTEGVDFVRIVGQLGPYTTVPRALETNVLRNTVLRDEVHRLARAVEAYADPERATQRIHNFLIALVAIVSSRALTIASILKRGQGVDADGDLDPQRLDEVLVARGEVGHEEFVTELIRTLSAALGASS